MNCAQIFDNFFNKKLFNKKRSVKFLVIALPGFRGKCFKHC